MQKEVIIFIVIVSTIIIYLIYKYFIAKDKFNNLKKDDDNNKIVSSVNNIKNIRNNFQNEEKVIKYFGGDYCPFSNTTSNAYMVMKDFENAYGDKVSVQYYWVGKDDNIMKELKVMYVPTILNGNNEQIELKLPEDVDTKDLSNNELKDLLLENIYNKL